MELRQIEAFVTVARTGSFTRTAEQLHRSQSAISQQIHILEREIGEPLLIRAHRRVGLSSLGRDLLPLAQGILLSKSLLLEKSKPSPLTVSGKLTVGTSAAATAYLWAGIYRAFAGKHPGVEMDIRTMQRTQDTIDSVVSGELDAGFANLPVGKPGLGYRALGFQEAVLTVPAGHPLVKLGVACRKYLAGEGFILYEPQISIRWLTDEFFRREGFTPRTVLESNDTHLIKRMVELGFGIAFLPDWSLEREIEEGRLTVVPIRGGRLIHELCVIFRRGGVTASVHTFVDFCSANRRLLPRVAQARNETV